jgi:hypothetical protein
VRLGKRSTRIWTGSGRQLTRVAIGLAIASAVSVDAHATTVGPTVGPGRIICNASFCELGSGARPKERIRVIVSDLPHDEVRRLRKCTGVSKPCIVTIDGAEQGSPMKIMAETIQWQD